MVSSEPESQRERTPTPNGRGHPPNARKAPLTKMCFFIYIMNTHSPYYTLDINITIRYFSNYETIRPHFPTPITTPFLTPGPRTGLPRTKGTFALPYPGHAPHPIRKVPKRFSPARSSHLQRSGQPSRFHRANPPTSHSSRRPNPQHFCPRHSRTPRWTLSNNHPKGFPRCLRALNVDS